METFQILSDQFNHFQHLFHRWLAIFFIISSYIFDLSSSPHTWGIRGRILSIVFLPVHPHLCWAYPSLHLAAISQNGSSPHTWGILLRDRLFRPLVRFIPTYVGHTFAFRVRRCSSFGSSPHTWGIRQVRGGLDKSSGSSPHTWGIHWTAVRKMAGFSHFSYDFIRKSYFVQGLVFFGVIGAEASPTHRRGRNQCLPGAHGGSVRNL